MLIESAGDAGAYSSNGAVGLLQVMPRDGLAAEFMCPNGPCFASRPTTDELMDPEFNLAYGARMLADLCPAHRKSARGAPPLWSHRSGLCLCRYGDPDLGEIPLNTHGVIA